MCAAMASTRTRVGCAVAEPVDHVPVPGANANCKLTGQRRVGRVGERRGLPVVNVFPGDGVRAADRVGETGEAVARASIDPLDSADRQDGHDVLGHGCHGWIPSR
jgi:hypothetical protein